MLVVVWCARAVLARPERPARSVAALAIVAGALDIAGNLLLLAALATSSLITVAVFEASAPGLAALAAFILLSERLTTRQTCGVVLAMIGAACSVAG